LGYVEKIAKPGTRHIIKRFLILGGGISPKEGTVMYENKGALGLSTAGAAAATGLSGNKVLFIAALAVLAAGVGVFVYTRIKAKNAKK
jgi:hypothetical protein